MGEKLLGDKNKQITSTQLRDQIAYWQDSIESKKSGQHGGLARLIIRKKIYEAIDEVDKKVLDSYDDLRDE